MKILFILAGLMPIVHGLYNITVLTSNIENDNFGSSIGLYGNNIIIASNNYTYIYDCTTNCSIKWRLTPGGYAVTAYKNKYLIAAGRIYEYDCEFGCILSKS